MKLSVVATLYRSEAYVDEFCRRAIAAATAYAGSDFEIVLVNDGSPDNSLERAVAIAAADPHVVVVDLSRNFGHHLAMMTGLDHARGETIFLLDSDLEEEPEYLSFFADAFEKPDVDVVYGVQQKRKGNWFERLSGGWFYPMFRMITGVAMPENIITARLMSRRYVNALLQHREREIFIGGLWHITGFKQVGKLVTKHGTSASTYTFRRKMSLFVNSIASFTNAPLIGIFYCGIGISLTAFFYNIYLVANWAFHSAPLLGWTSVMASIWLMGGLMISFIGILGIYLSKIFTETKQRPYTIVRHVYGRD